MNSLRRIDLPQVLGILLLGGIVFLLPLASQAAPATPAEGNADADATDTIQLQPEFRFDDPRPPADADPAAGEDRNLLQGQTTFDDPRPRPDRDTIQLQPQIRFDDPRPPADADPAAGEDRNLLQGQTTFDDPRPRPDRDTIQLQPQIRFDDPRPPADADPVAGQDRNLLQGETTFDDPRPEDPPRAELPPQSAVVPNDERPTLSMNPSTGPVTVMYGQDDLRVEVYEITGRRVAAFDGSAGRAQWDGRDSYGRPVARGIYFARVMTGPGTPGAVVRIVRR
jgi:hypothetical protein